MLLNAEFNSSYVKFNFNSIYLVKLIPETNEAQSDVSEVEPSCDDSKWERKPNMAARPLPVPVENESFYMNIDRQEAENLLLGQPDGTFILRPSSQVRLLNN